MQTVVKLLTNTFSNRARRLFNEIGMNTITN